MPLTCLWSVHTTEGPDPDTSAQDLSSESQTAAIRAYASYSDGYMNDVTDLPGLNVSTLAPSYIQVNDPLAVSHC